MLYTLYKITMTNGVFHNTDAYSKIERNRLEYEDQIKATD